MSRMNVLKTVAPTDGAAALNALYVVGTKSPTPAPEPITRAAAPNPTPAKLRAAPPPNPPPPPLLLAHAFAAAFASAARISATVEDPPPEAHTDTATAATNPTTSSAQSRDVVEGLFTFGDCDAIGTSEPPAHHKIEIGKNRGEEERGRGVPNLSLLSSCLRTCEINDFDKTTILTNKDFRNLQLMCYKLRKREDSTREISARRP